MADISYIGLGRRKTSVAKTRLVAGTGKITINGKKPNEVFPNALVVQDMEQPLVITETRKTFDVEGQVSGGGFTGQAGAVRLAITRALINANPEFKKVLKAGGMVTRDSRSKERKKFGKYGARRSPQFTKR